MPSRKYSVLLAPTPPQRTPDQTISPEAAANAVTASLSESLVIGTRTVPFASHAALASSQLRLSVDRTY